MSMSWHMTKGQRAMAVATIYPEPEKGGRGQKFFVTKGFSEGHLSKARTVLAASTSMATDVLAGTLSLATLGVPSRAGAPYSAISGREAACHQKRLRRAARAAGRAAKRPRRHHWRDD